MAAITHFVARHAHQPVPIIFLQQSFELSAAVGVGAFCNDQIALVLANIFSTHQAGNRGLNDDRARLVISPTLTDSHANFFKMFWHRTATTTDDIHTKLINKSQNPFCKIRWIHGEMALSVDHDRHAGIGQYADQSRPVMRDILGRLCQFRRTKSAVQAENVHFRKRYHRSDKRRWIGAGQHLLSGVLIKAGLHHDRYPPAGIFHRAIGCDYNIFDHQQILLRFKKQHINTTIDQALDLCVIAVFHDVPGGHAQGQQLGATADGTDDISWTIRRFKSVARSPCNLCRQYIDFISALGHVGFSKYDLIGAKRIGFHRIATNRQKRFVNFLDHFRPGDVEYFGNIFLIHPVAVQVKLPSLQIRTHRTINHDDALLDHIQK